MARYGMVIDLRRCFGCYACQMACKAEHYTPPSVFWGKVLKGEGGRFPGTVRQALPVLCMQCKEPECMKVCPTKATTQRPDGVIMIDKGLCVGCRYCMVACPYGSRYFLLEWRSYFPPEEPPYPLQRFADPLEEYAKQQWEQLYGTGVVTKCNFCLERIQKGLDPACVEACPAEARYFGDLDDPQSEVSRLVKTQRGFQLAPEFGTDPSVYYLPPR